MTIGYVIPLETRLSRDNSYSYRRINVFRVVTDDANTDPKDVMFAAAGGPYDFTEEGATLAPRDPERMTWEWGSTEVATDHTQEVTDIDVRYELPMGQNTGDRRAWIVTFTYADWLLDRPGFAQKDARKRGEDGAPQTPLEEEPQFSGSFFSTEEWQSMTADGAAIVNSAEQPYPEQRVSKDYDTIIVAKNIDIVDETDRCASVNAVNEVEFWGLAARTLKLAKWLLPGGVRYYTDLYGVKQSYIHSVMEFHVNRDTWDVSHPDYGTLTLADGGNADPAERYQTVDVQDTQSRYLPIPSNVLLNGSGAFDTTQTTVDDPANVAGPFEMLKEVDFSSGVYSQYIPQDLPGAMGGTDS